MKALILLALVAFAAAFDFPDEWAAWKKEYNKQYKSDEEELLRHKIWEANMVRVNEHNVNADKFGFTLGMNEYADLESKEFSRLMNGYRGYNHSTSSKVFVVDPNFEANDTVDWRTKGYVTGVKNQGQCGSCWAFSTTGSLEGQHFKKTGKLISLSEQNLVDCCGKYGNLGCMGGLMDNAFRWIKENDGIDTEASYPYRGDDGKCQFVKSNVAATDEGYVDIDHEDEKALKQAVARIGPISVAIDASWDSFHLYSGGVYYESQCSDSQLDHGVLAVGYGTENGKDYWLVKNSWGTSWGMKGYIMMSRNRDNNCGIASRASYPIV